jgi:hypothetical protein
MGDDRDERRADERPSGSDRRVGRERRSTPEPLPGGEERRTRVDRRSGKDRRKKT